MCVSITDMTPAAPLLVWFRPEMMLRTSIPAPVNRGCGRRPPPEKGPCGKRTCNPTNRCSLSGVGQSSILKSPLSLEHLAASGSFRTGNSTVTPRCVCRKPRTFRTIISLRVCVRARQRDPGPHEPREHRNHGGRGRKVGCPAHSRRWPRHRRFRGRKAGGDRTNRHALRTDGPSGRKKLPPYAGCGHCRYPPQRHRFGRESEIGSTRARPVRYREDRRQARQLRRSGRAERRSVGSGAKS